MHLPLMKNSLINLSGPADLPFESSSIAFETSIIDIYRNIEVTKHDLQFSIQIPFVEINDVIIRSIKCTSGV